MKIIESDEESSESGQDIPAVQYRGRGRPRKSDSPGVAKLSVPVMPERRRGRPRKNVLLPGAASPMAKAPSTPSRGRGRPRKEKTDIKSPLTKDPTLQHKKRGRPKKNVDDVKKTPEKSESFSVPPRGRGRTPKSVKKFDSMRLLATAYAGSTPHRGRGRPRKNFGASVPLAKGQAGLKKDYKKVDAIKLLAQALGRHGRGRPRKGTGIQDAVKLLQKDPTLPKLGRGRPPKSIKRIFAMKLLAKAVSIGCHDGSSKSLKRNVDVTELSQNATGAPRRRGRPRKVDAVQGITKLLEKTSVVAPRGRGRPKKVSATPVKTALADKDNSQSDLEGSAAADDQHTTRPLILCL